MILLADLASLIIAFHLAYFIRVEIIQDLFNVANPWFFPLEHFYKMYYLLLVFVLIFSYEKLYAYHRRYDFSREFVYIARGLFISVILIALLVYLSRTYETFTRTVPILMALTGMITVPLFRFLTKRVLMALGFYIKHAAVIGLNEETARVRPTLEKMKSMGYKIVQVLDIDSNNNQPGLDNLPKNVETLVIVSRGMDSERLNRFINRWENRFKEIKIVSDSSYLKTIGVETEYVEELLVMRMANKLLSPANRLFKRMFDLAVSLVGLIVLLPLFSLIALAIKTDSRGPVFFIQERFGKEGKKFKFFKFRTMYMDGDGKLHEYLSSRPELRQEWERYKKLKTFDPRVTGIGRFLRRFSLDEAPQLWNVLKGDMSIVGPRPYLVREKEEI
jgi:undecaprenyl-phosphate galactose phosphotransferase